MPICFAKSKAFYLQVKLPLDYSRSTFIIQYDNFKMFVNIPRIRLKLYHIATLKSFQKLHKKKYYAGKKSISHLKLALF